ncbi:MAG TPA: hypothetical protein PKC65_10945 [Pyrinomonadaceae bacterium]|nr:hypothetical protein [Pyrinomonadaceae bacterium]
MKNSLLKAAFVCAALLFCVLSANAQTPSTGSAKPSEHASSPSKGGNAVLNGAGKVAVVVVKSAAKGTWAVTKFTAKNVAKPILFKLLPKAAKFALKGTGLAAKHLLPYAAKLAVL